MNAFNVDQHPGESVNRPRYTVNFWILLALFLSVWWQSREIERELRWYGFRPNFSVGWHHFIYIVAILAGFDVRLSIECRGLTPLKRGAKVVYKEFLERTKLTFVGITACVKLPNSGGVLHPVDMFIKHFYDRLFPMQCCEALRTYKRTNPTLELKLAHLEKYAQPLIDVIPVQEAHAAVDTILDELDGLEGFDAFCEEARMYVRDKAFEMLQIDRSSASGFPYKPGRKKRDDEFDAVNKARDMLHDDLSFDAYLSDHQWYTTGRARMQNVEDADAGRLIVYAGYAYLLIVMLFIQPWTRFMNRSFQWCAVGFSWTHGGADKLAEFMKAKYGRAPHGYRYVSLDISGWDTKLHHDLMMCLVRFYTSLLLKAGVGHGYSRRFIACLKAMIDAVVIMPLGYAFQLFQGMKSGWGATANDNTLLHEVVFRAVMKRIGFIHHILYGDDNLMLVPDSITDDMLVHEYGRFGLKIKKIHSSVMLEDVDFLAKHIKFYAGHYYVFRDAVETHSRILMPEEMDPRRRDRPNAVIGAERVLGHLLDNPFNSDVRKVCYTILHRLRDEYGIEYIDVHAGILKHHPWRQFDLDLIPKRFPTIPSVEFIEELYGVPIPNKLGLHWPKEPVIIEFDESEESDSLSYDMANGYANELAYRMSGLARRRMRSIVRRCSPFAQPVACYGLHAARFEFAIKYFSIEFASVLDFGSHPGACAASAMKYCSDVVCVSLKPPKDKREFCPYVARGDGIKLVKADVNSFSPFRNFDLLHDDTDAIGDRTIQEDINIGLGMIYRAQKNMSYVTHALFTLKEVDHNVIDALYNLYKAYGHIDFVKPLFSSPWKSEFMVYVKRTKEPAMRKARFIRRFNAFLNAMAPQMFRWNELLTSALTDFQGVEAIVSNPFQSDSYEKEWIRPWQ